LIGGTKRYCTDLMRVTKGRIVGKTGADGVYCLSIPEKNWGIAIKVDDGKMGPQYQVAHGLLSALGLLLPDEIEALKSHGYCENLNFAGNCVGYSDVVPLNSPL
jgi:L-asparaginase II